MERRDKKNSTAINKIITISEEIHQKLKEDGYLLEFYLLLFTNAIEVEKLFPLESHNNGMFDTVSKRINGIIGVGPMKKLKKLLWKVFLPTTPTGDPVRDMNAATIDKLAARLTDK